MQCRLDYPRSIRLITIYPAPSQPDEDGSVQPLVAQMTSEPLSGLNMQYEALSYVWGSAETPRSITIVFVQSDNRASTFECSITENLWNALCALRSTNQPRTVWTDALCINQNDIPEKNAQVAQIRDVYANAKRTVAYLGPPFDGLDALVAYRDCYKTKTSWIGRPPAPGGHFMRFVPERGIVRVNQKPHRIVASLISIIIPYLYLRYGIAYIATKSFAKRIAMAFTAINAAFTLPLLFSQFRSFDRNEPEVLFSPDQLICGLAEFFARPWFRRAWIVQECVVFPSVYFRVGREEFDIEDILRMVRERVELKSFIAWSAPTASHLVCFQRMIDMRLERSERQSALSLSTLIQWTWNYGLVEEASNPRDKIFALLGLVDENAEFFVNYVLQLHEVFWHYGRVRSQRAGAFMLLEDPRRHDELSMPSWVPDFSKTSHCRLYGFNGFYDSCHRIPVQAYELSIDGSSLEVNAIVLGGVDFLGRLYEPMSIESSEIRHAFFLRDAESLDRVSSTGLTGLINSLKP